MQKRCSDLVTEDASKAKKRKTQGSDLVTEDASKAKKRKTQGSDRVTEDVLFFSEGILSEILSWLEVKYLLRCKSVCKLWYAIINNTQFVGMHATHVGRRSFHCLKSESLDSETIKSDRVTEKIMYVDRTRTGLLLVERSSLSASVKPEATYRLSNPSMKLILDLPDPHKRVCFMSIFQNSSTDSYYVFSAYTDEENDKQNFELLDLGGQSNDPSPNANLSWKTVNISEFDRLNRQQKYKFSGLLCQGILYILVLLKDGLSNPGIICFDLVKQQTCTTLDVPDQSLRFKSSEVHFQSWRGKPALSFVLEEKLNVWVLEDYKKQKWADTIHIPMPSLKEYPSWTKVIPHMHCGNDGEVLLLYSETSKCWLYSPKSKKRSEVLSPPKRVPATLVSVRGMQPEKKEC